MQIDPSAANGAFVRMLKNHRKLILALAVAVIALVPTAVWASHNASDVPDADWAHADVEWMYAKQLTNGCTENLYCPDGNLTRREMAAFTHREQLNLGTRTAAEFFGPVEVPTTTDTHIGSVFIDVPIGGGTVQAVGAFNDFPTAADHLGVFWLEASNAAGGECDGEGFISLFQPYGTYETGWGAGGMMGFFAALPGTKRVDVCAWTTEAMTAYADLTLTWVAAGPDGGDFPIPAGGVGTEDLATFNMLKGHLATLDAERANR